MVSITEVADLLTEVPAKWREEFCSFLEGNEPSNGFAEYFDSDVQCQQVAEDVMRLLDRDMISCFSELQFG